MAGGGALLQPHNVVSRQMGVHRVWLWWLRVAMARRIGKFDVLAGLLSLSVLASWSKHVGQLVVVLCE